MCLNEGIECRQGVCVDGECVCDLFYNGMNCDHNWRRSEIPVLFYIISYFLAVFNVLYLISVVLMFVRIRYLRGSMKKVFYPFGFQSFSLITLFMFALLRSFVYILDPYGYLQILGIHTFNFIIGISVIFLMSAYAAAIIFWAEISTGKLSTSSKRFINKSWARVTLFLAILFAVILEVIFNIASITKTIPWFTYVYYSIIGVIVTTMSVFLCIYGFWIYRLLNQVESNRNTYSSKLTRFIIIASFFGIIQVLVSLTRALTTLIGAYDEHIAALWPIYQIMFRALEITLAAVLLYCISPGLSWRFLMFWRQSKKEKMKDVIVNETDHDSIPNEEIETDGN